MKPGEGKPDLIRHMIERVSSAPYLDLFGEQAVVNWTVWNPKMGGLIHQARDDASGQTPVDAYRQDAKPVSQSVTAKAMAQLSPSLERIKATEVSASTGAFDFRLPPEISFAKEMNLGGAAYVFRHDELGLLGRIFVQEIAGSQCLVSLEVAGDPEAPTTDRRMAVFEPVAKELVQRLELHSGRIEAVLGITSPVTSPDADEIVESKLIQCGQCDAGVALLIFAPGATDMGRFEDYARRMYKQIGEMKVPTYIIGPELGDGPMRDRPADILKVWPEREPMQWLRPDEFNPLLDELTQAHCADSSAQQTLERMWEADDIKYEGTRRHRGASARNASSTAVSLMKMKLAILMRSGPSIHRSNGRNAGIFSHDETRCLSIYVITATVSGKSTIALVYVELYSGLALAGLDTGGFPGTSSSLLSHWSSLCSTCPAVQCCEDRVITLVVAELDRESGARVSATS